MYFFSADFHVHHANVLRYCNRPFDSVEEMNEELIRRHNEVVSPKDTFIHIGDFSFASKAKTQEIIDRLNGTKIFLQGSHDKWLKGADQIWSKKINGIYVVCCHYPMISWPRSHYESILLHGHHHGELQEHRERMLDVGVDTNNYYPYSFEQIVEILGLEREV